MRATSRLLLTCVGSLLVLASAAAQTPVGTAFTYQGRLTDGGSPASGVYDLQFTLYDALSGGAQVGPTVTRSDVLVANGLFTVSLDFGSSAFAGEARWLEVGAKPRGSPGAFTILSPRQELTPSPNAVFTQKVPWTGISGIPAGFADGVDNDSGGDITAVGTAAGSGLQGGVTTGAANLSLVTTCTGSQPLLKWNGAAWACGADADSGGDITEVIAGTGLTGGGTTAAVTLAANLAGSGAASTLARSDHDHFGAVWSGTTTNPAGLYVNQQSADSAGVLGTASGAGITYGVWGQSTSTAGRGVYGVAGATSGFNSGVYGDSSSTQGRGVYGVASATSGFAYGVAGWSLSASGRGVYGLASESTGANQGVHGESASLDGQGVYGLASATTGAYAAGVWGESSSSQGTAIWGMALASTGTTTGVFGDSFSPQGVGISGYGGTGGRFDGPGTGSASLGYGDRGIWAKGTFAGGTFSHPNNVTFWADVATTYSKIWGTGNISFVQNHPYERDRVVVYAAPEGDEVAVYTRGSARLVEGVAHVKLGPTFAWVANPDLGLTAHLTPRGGQADLWVESVGTEELVVRGPAGSNAAFDYLVYGLRIGFEELPIVQPKPREAFLPDPAAVTEAYGGHTDLQAFSAMERFRGMRAELGDPAPVELPRARALAAAIDTGRAEVLAAADEALAQRRAEMEARRLRRKDDGKQPAPALETDRSPATPNIPSSPLVLASPPLRLADLPAARSAMPAPEPEERAAPLAPPAPALPASVALPVSEPVEPGDLLTVDAAHPGELRRADVASDPGIAAIAVGSSGMTGGRLLAPVADGRYARVKADASLGPIRPGDLLTASPTPGHAMRAPEGKAAGALIGKALEGLDSGTGQVRVLVLLR